MISKTITALLLIFCTSVQAQPTGCGTVLPEQMRQWLISRSLSGQTEKEQQRSISLLPVQFHIVGTSQGDGYYNLGHLASVLCRLNQLYAPMGFYFYLYGDLHYINNTSYYVHGYSVGYNMMQANNVPDVINVYVVDDPAGNCGYFSGYADGIAVAKSCMTPGSTTLAHEIGHYFSLPHPFYNVMGNPECVNGSNCTTGGDLFCDTPADYLGYRWDCPYTGNDTDACGSGQVIQPDETLIMSYALDHCSDRFSPQQQSAMAAYLTGNRTYLLAHPDPLMVTSLDAVMPIQPEYNDPDVPYNYVELKWTAVPDAEQYYVWVSRSLDPSNLDFEAYTGSTSLITQLDSGYAYRWQVKPLSAAYTCGPSGIMFRFVTGAPVNLGIPEGAAGRQIQIFPNPVPSGTDLTVVLSGAGSCPAGVCMMDAVGKTVLLKKQLIHPGPVMIPVPVLPGGIYTLQIISMEYVICKKIFIY